MSCNFSGKYLLSPAKINFSFSQYKPKIQRLRLLFSYEDFQYFARDDGAIGLRPVTVEADPGRDKSVCGSFFSADYLRRMQLTEEEVLFVTSQQELRRPKSRARKRKDSGLAQTDVSQARKRRRVAEGEESTERYFVTEEIFFDKGGLDGKAWVIETEKRVKKNTRFSSEYLLL